MFLFSSTMQKENQHLVHAQARGNDPVYSPAPLLSDRETKAPRKDKGHPAELRLKLMCLHFGLEGTLLSMIPLVPLMSL